jgi:hypothetical protein
MHIEFKTKRDLENRQLIQEYYNSFEKIFKERQNKTLIQDNFSSGDSQSYIESKITSYIKNEQVVCHHDWGINRALIFQLNLAYFHYIINNKQYVFGMGYQLQKSTIKINCAKNPYIDSVPEEIANIIPIFKKYKNSDFNNRLGTPRTHAYISISKKIEHINQYSINEQCEYLYKLLINSMDLINSIKNEIENIGGEFLKYHAIANN